MSAHKREIKWGVIGVALLLCALSAQAAQVVTTVCRVKSANFTTSSASFVNVTGLSFTAQANKFYEVDVLLNVSTNNTGGLLPTISFSGAGASGSYYVTGMTSNAAQSPSAQLLGVQPTFAYGTTANQSSVVMMKAWVATAANAGDITVKVLKFSGGTATVFVESRMTVTDANTSSTKNVNNGNESPGAGGSPPTIGDVDLTPVADVSKQATIFLCVVAGMAFAGVACRHVTP